MSDEQIAEAFALCADFVEAHALAQAHALRKDAAYRKVAEVAAAVSPDVSEDEAVGRLVLEVGERFPALVSVG